MKFSICVHTDTLIGYVTDKTGRPAAQRVQDRGPQVLGCVSKRQYQILQCQFLRVVDNGCRQHLRLALHIRVCLSIYSIPSTNATFQQQQYAFATVHKTAPRSHHIADSFPGTTKTKIVCQELSAFY